MFCRYHEGLKDDAGTEVTYNGDVVPPEEPTAKISNAGESCRKRFVLDVYG